MKKLIFLIFLFTPPLYWGYSGKSIVAPVVGIIVLDVFAVSTGWRHPNSGPIKSAIIGALFASLAVMPAYFLGRWIGF